MKVAFTCFTIINVQILGPILFIIDINDFSRASDKLFSILYADYTSVFIEGYEYDKLIDIMNNEMKKVDTGCAKKKKDILNIHIKSEGVNIFSQKLG